MTRLSRLSRGERNEDGAFLVLYVIMVVAIFTMAAIGVDLASLRQDRRGDRAAADAGAAAGALSLTDNAGGPLAGCVAAWNGAVRNLGMTLPGTGLSTNPCNAAGSAITSTTTCVSTDAQRDVSATAGGYTVTVSTPVPDASTLMKADTAGGDTTQAANATNDGSQCDRIGVTISYTRASFFGNVMGRKNNTTTVHSVARALTGNGSGPAIPALVALNKTACQTVNAGTGFIEAKNNGTKPGLIQADSDASGCNNSSHVLEVQGSGVHIQSDPGSGGTPGLLYYYAKSKPAQAYDSGRPGDYVGTLTKLQQPITRSPVDDTYHCSNAGVDLLSVCDSSADFYVNEILPYKTNDPPTPFTTFPGLGQSCSSPPPAFVGNYKINCPSGFSVSSPILFTPALLATTNTVVFTGDVNITSGGDLKVNTASNDPSTGLPVTLPTSSTANTLLAIRGSTGINFQSTGAAMHLAQTLVYTTNGGGSLQGGPTIAWSAWNGGDLNGLMWWSEAAATLAFGGGPNLHSDGIVMIPNMLLSIQGSGVLDATNVQFWCDRVETQGSTQLVLKPDPKFAASSKTAITHLIR